MRPFGRHSVDRRILCAHDSSVNANYMCAPDVAIDVMNQNITITTDSQYSIARITEGI